MASNSLGIELKVRNGMLEVCLIERSALNEDVRMAWSAIPIADILHGADQVEILESTEGQEVEDWKKFLGDFGERARERTAKRLAQEAKRRVSDD
jgi:hypothetical protein